MHFDSPFATLSDKGNLGEQRRLEQRKIFKKIIEYIETHKTPRTDLHFDIQASGYDIKTEAQKLQEIYIDLWNKN